MVENQILFYFFKQSVHHRHPHSLRSRHLEQLDRFGENQLAVHALLGNETDHAVSGEQFLQFRKGTGTAVTDVVVVVVTESDGRHTCGDYREIRRGVNLVSQEPAGFACLHRILPQIATVLVSQLADSCQSLVIADELGVLAVGALERVHQVDEFIGSDFSSRCSSHANLCATLLGKQTQGLTYAGTIEEGILFRIGQSLCKLTKDVLLQLECVVVEQFLGDLHGNMEFMGIQIDLGKLCITPGEFLALIDPRSRRLGGSDVDLTLTTGGDGVAQLTEDVLFLQSLDQTGVILFGNQVATVSVNALLENIADLAEVGTESLEHTVLIGIGSTAGLGLLVIHRSAIHRLFGDGSRSGLGKLCVHSRHGFHTLDFSTVVLNLLFHLGIGLGILIGKQTVTVALGLYKSLCSFPSLVTLCAQFVDSHNKLPPVFDKIEPIQKVIGSVLVGGFGFNRALCSDFVHEGIDHIGLGIQHGDCGGFHIFGIAGTLDDLISKAEFHGLVCIHPGFSVHKVGQLCAG
uniref:Uncharacterized protein n=1 Tax=Siphoviridae sp. ctneY2 TaxID=2825664 RepID=A0A8S5V739_9CAUD|nr:MAG TPA: hypothetical protein [Siphoviridae sp. ctneY2]